MSFQDKVVVVTGDAQGIGKCCAECFEREGAYVHVIDIQQGPWFVGDLAGKSVLERFAAGVIAKSGHVDVIVNNAMQLFKGIDECTYEEFAYAQAVGVVAPFYLVKLFKDHFAEGASIINISSSRDRMSQPQSESYTAAKAALPCSRTRLPRAWPGASASIRSRRAGSTLRSRPILDLTLRSTWPVASAIRSTLQTWFSSSPRTRRASSRAKTSYPLIKYVTKTLTDKSTI